MEPNLSQALHLLNGETVNAKITAGGTVAASLRDKKTAPQIIDELYLRCLARKPTSKEQAELMEFFKEGRPELEVLNDVFWSLLNSKEFLFNH